MYPPRDSSSFHILSCDTNDFKFPLLFFVALVIGFVPTTYTVNEGSGPAVLIVQVISGDLETQIVVNLTTFDDSAVGR